MKRNYKNIIAIVISALAMVIANISSSMCFWFFFEEEEMPEILIKKDK